MVKLPALVTKRTRSAAEAAGAEAEAGACACAAPKLRVPAISAASMAPRAPRRVKDMGISKGLDQGDRRIPAFDGCAIPAITPHR
ncbi:hypothetical protein GCM10009078_16980 [Cupriavidus gilardii]